MQGLLGLLVFIIFAWSISEHKKKVSFRMIIKGLALQFVVGLILLKLPVFRDFFFFLNKLVFAIQESTHAGTSFVFGYIGGGEVPFDITKPYATFILAIQALPIILFMSALSAVLFYWRVIPNVVRAFSWCLQKTMKIGGAEGVGVSANVFVGMVESPLFIRPYLKDMTRSELFSIMTCGMATIAGTVMVLYAGLLSGHIPDIMGHILTASIISVPAALTIAKIMVPETGELTTGQITAPEKYMSSMDAITKGTIQGVQLLINIIAMLVVLVAIVHFMNMLFGLLPNAGGESLSLQRILGYIMAPVVWLMGVPCSESVIAGSLMGTKTILNEFLAYLQMSQLGEGVLSSKTMLIMTYAMCGFANPGSLGIMIGGMGSMAPDRRDEIVALGLRSIVAGTMATCMTGAVVGIINY